MSIWLKARAVSLRAQGSRGFKATIALTDGSVRVPRDRREGRGPD